MNKEIKDENREESKDEENQENKKNEETQFNLKDSFIDNTQNEDYTLVEYLDKELYINNI